MTNPDSPAWDCPQQPLPALECWLIASRAMEVLGHGETRKCAEFTESLVKGNCVVVDRAYQVIGILKPKEKK